MPAPVLSTNTTAAQFPQRSREGHHRQPLTEAAWTANRDRPWQRRARQHPWGRTGIFLDLRKHEAPRRSGDGCVVCRSRLPRTLGLYRLGHAAQAGLTDVPALQVVGRDRGAGKRCPDAGLLARSGVGGSAPRQPCSNHFLRGDIAVPRSHTNPSNRFDSPISQKPGRRGSGRSNCARSHRALLRMRYDY